MTGLGLATLRAYAHLAPTERGGYRLARLARRLVPRERWDGVFPVGGGLTMGLDLSTYPDVAMAAGLYELDTQRLLRRLLRRGSRFVDGGANVGFFSLLAARVVGDQGRVDAFEPDPLNRQRLLDNLARNGLSIRVHALALSDRDETITLHHPAPDSGRNHGETSRFALADAESETFDVPAVRLDHSPVGGVPDVVKLDLEGGELLAMRGASAWLDAPRPPAFVVEHNPAADQRAGHKPGDLWRELSARREGYACWVVSARPRRLASPDELDALPRQVNLLLRVSDATP